MAYICDLKHWCRVSRVVIEILPIIQKLNLKFTISKKGHNLVKIQDIELGVSDLHYDPEYTCEVSCEYLQWYQRNSLSYKNIICIPHGDCNSSSFS